MKRQFFLIWIIVILSCSNKVRVYDITQFGAKADDKTMNTKFINAAIEACHKNGEAEWWFLKVYLKPEQLYYCRM